MHTRLHAPTILCTTDYRIFKLTQLNRPISNKHVQHLVQSIKRENLLAQHPIIVNDQMEILSGQHRWKAAQILKVPIFYTKKNTSDEFVFQANWVQHKGTLKESVNFYAERKGLEDYKYLKNAISDLNIPFGSVMALLGFYLRSHGSNDLLCGNFKFPDSKEVRDEIIRKYKEVRHKLSLFDMEHKGQFENGPFCAALYLFCKNKDIDWKHFMKRLHYDGELLNFSTRSVPTWIKKFTEIYNRRCSVKKI